MKRRFWLSLAMLAVGSGLLITAGFAAPADSGNEVSAGQVVRQGGTLRIDLDTDIDFVDPALAYFSNTFGQLEYATQAMLLNYPDAEAPRGSRLRPEVATSMPRVSRDGKTYTFTLRTNYRLSNGKRVGPANFVRAIERVANKEMNSPFAQFISDIVGAQEMIDGKANRVSGITARGNTLTIRLKSVAPDFLSRIAMPWAGAVDTTLPINPKGVDAPVHTAGPYYVAERTPNRSVLVKENPFYRGPRPSNVSQIAYTCCISLEATRLRLERGETDLGGIPPAAWAEIAQRFPPKTKPGVEGRFYVRPDLVFWYLALNTERPLFRGNVNLRKAVNHAIDRPALVRQRGAFAGARTDQVLPPGMPGYRNWDIYPLKRPNTQFAQRIARGNTRDGKAVLYTCNRAHCPPSAEIIQFNLKQIGVDVEVKQFARAVQHAQCGTRGEPFDICYEGWGADYPDPSNFINVLLQGGDRIQEAHNNNVSYFNDPSFNRRMEQASRLTGEQRYTTYGLLDRDITKNAAPLASYINPTYRAFVGPRVGCWMAHAIYVSTDLAAVCLK